MTLAREWPRTAKLSPRPPSLWHLGSSVSIKNARLVKAVVASRNAPHGGIVTGPLSTAWRRWIRFQAIVGDPRVVPRCDFYVADSERLAIHYADLHPWCWVFFFIILLEQSRSNFSWEDLRQIFDVIDIFKIVVSEFFLSQQLKTRGPSMFCTIDHNCRV